MNIDTQSIPSYASFSVQNQSNFTLTSSTTNVIYTLSLHDALPISATWYKSGTFNFDVNLKDGNLHQFRKCARVWYSNGCTSYVEIFEEKTSAVLDTRSISSFSNGMYLVWNISGHTKINVNRTAENK